MPSDAVIVLVTGPSSVGKTTLANSITSRFGLPLFSKDRFKEMMFEVTRPGGDYADLGHDFSRTLGRMSVGCLEIILDAVCSTGVSAIFESNFDTKLFSPVLNRCRQRRPVRIVQICMTCRGDVLLERFISRECTTRHPGHGGLRHLEAIRPAILLGKAEPIEIQDGDELVTLDTTDLAHLDYDAVYKAVARHLVS